VNKQTFKVSEFSYFTNPDEYAEACKNVLYKHDAEDDELTHWGVVGMKWGVRRYQNKDGSLTKAGQKRYNKEMEKLRAEARVLKTREETKAKLDKLEAKRQSNTERKQALDADKKRKGKRAKGKDNSGKKSIKDMTNEELAIAIERGRLESQYKQLNPDTPTKSGFMKKFMEDAVKPALINAGRNALQNYFTSKASEMMKGKTDPDGLQALKVAKERLQLKWDSKVLKDKLDGKYDDIDYERELKKFRYEDELEARAKRRQRED
jgi:hypothetical protein